MGEITKREKLAKASLYQIGYEYLRDNFHKFSEPNKIRVAISILQIFEKDDSKTGGNEFVMKVMQVNPETDGRHIPIARFSVPSLQ